jgi:hypothetical protein
MRVNNNMSIARFVFGEKYGTKAVRSTMVGWDG